MIEKIIKEFELLQILIQSKNIVLISLTIKLPTGEQLVFQ